MNKKKIKWLKKSIIRRKFVLNILLKYLSPTNTLIVYLSQSLDKLISRYQFLIYRSYKNRCYTKEYKKVA